MDLCAVSNISLIIMDSYLHGYYIHGEAPWVSSDVVISQLKKNLDQEGEGKSSLKRGISEKYPNHQSYEIYIPQKFRQELDLIYKQEIPTHKLQQINKERQKAANRVRKMREGGDGPAANDVEERQRLIGNGPTANTDISNHEFKR